MGPVSVALSDVNSSVESPDPWWVVEVASACNNNCGFCCLDIEGKGSSFDGEASPQSRLREGQSGGHDAVAFVGAEPTLSERLPDVIKEAKRMGYSRLLLQTNGRRLAYRSYASTLVESGLTHVEVSLHGALSAVHDYHTRVPKSFEHTLVGIGAARDCQVNVGVSTVITRSNFRQLVEVAGLLDRLKVRHWCLSVAQAIGGAARDFQRLIPHWGMIQPYLSDAIQIADDYGIQTAVRGAPAGFLEDSLVIARKDTASESFDFVCMSDH
jgi:MoaA/NifB/PqqE/SkfB family radical SAM enzyme